MVAAWSAIVLLQEVPTSSRHPFSIRFSTFERLTLAIVTTNYLNPTSHLKLLKKNEGRTIILSQKDKPVVVQANRCPSFFASNLLLFLLLARGSAAAAATSFAPPFLLIAGGGLPPPLLLPPPESV
mmetsp:Transcript_22751/g.35155  ORF Transcript_22751/g.35155 Transcript_22751/m.35155 type:complete len:126 (+) Transcript_22751:66-443(+)